jgi:hypothetical protein
MLHLRAEGGVPARDLADFAIGAPARDLADFAHGTSPFLIGGIRSPRCRSSADVTERAGRKASAGLTIPCDPFQSTIDTRFIRAGALRRACLLPIFASCLLIRPANPSLIRLIVPCIIKSLWN